MVLNKIPVTLPPAAIDDIVEPLAADNGTADDAAAAHGDEKEQPLSARSYKEYNPPPPKRTCNPPPFEHLQTNSAKPFTGEDWAFGLNKQLALVLAKLDLLTEKVDKCVGGSTLIGPTGPTVPLSPPTFLPPAFQLGAEGVATAREGLQGNVDPSSPKSSYSRPETHQGDHHVHRIRRVETAMAAELFAVPMGRDGLAARALKKKPTVPRQADFLNDDVGSMERQVSGMSRQISKGQREPAPAPVRPPPEAAACSDEHGEVVEGKVVGLGEFPSELSRSTSGMASAAFTSATPAPVAHYHAAPAVLKRLETKGRDELAALAMKKKPTMPPPRAATHVADDDISSNGEHPKGKAATFASEQSKSTVQAPSQPSGSEGRKRVSIMRAQSGVSGASSGSQGPSQAIQNVFHKAKDARHRMVSARVRARSHMIIKVWHFLEDSESSYGAFVFSIMTPFIVILSVLFTVLLNVQVETTAMVPDSIGVILEIVLEVCFAIEVGIRCYVCPNRLAFCFQFYNIIDVLSVFPLFLRASEGFVIPERTSTALVPSILFGVVPALRLLKVLRYFKTFRLLLKAFKVAFEALPVMLYTLAIMGLVFSSMIYFVEDRSNVESLPRAMWLMIVTMTTVGYGDMVPKTTTGTVLVAIMAICSVIYMAIPLGLVGNAFNEVWKDRHQIVLCTRARYCLTQWGYTAETISGLFQDYDDNGDGELNLNEFRLMLNDMRVGLPDKTVVKLFQTFDSDQSGFVTDVEFVKFVFPDDYHELYANAIDEGRISNIQEEHDRALRAVRESLEDSHTDSSALQKITENVSTAVGQLASRFTTRSGNSD